MQPVRANETEVKFTGRHMLLVVVGFFGVIISVNLLLAYFATQSWTGLIVKNSYVASQHFNEKLAEAEAQKALGWQSQMSVDKEGLLLSLRDKEGNALAGLDVSAKAQRPTHENDDFAVQFTELSNGQYSYAGELAKGAWVFDVAISSAGKNTYRQIYKVVIR